MSSTFIDAKSNETNLIAHIEKISKREAVKLTLDGVVEQHVKGDLNSAKQLFLKAAALDSLYSPPRYYLSSIYALQSADSSLIYARKAYELDTLNRWYAKRYAFLELNAGSASRALEIYENLISSSDADLETFQQKSMAHQRKGDFIGAIEVLDSALSRFGFNPSIGAMKMEIYAKRLGDNQKAEEVAQQLLQNSGESVDMRLGIASLLFSSGLDSLALSEVEDIIEIDTTDIRPRLLLIEWFDSKGNYPALFAQTKHIMEHDALEEDYKVNIFESFTSDVNFYATYYLNISELATTLWRKYPNSDRVLKLYTSNLMAGGMVELVADIYQELVSRQECPKYEHFIGLIDIETYLKRPDRVKKTIRNAVKCFPDSVELYPTVGYAYHYAGMLEDAVDGYKWAMRYIKGDDKMVSTLWGGVGDCYQTLAQQSSKIKEQRGFVSKSYLAYEKALSFNKENSLTLNNYAYALTQFEPTPESIAKALAMSTRANALSENNASYIDTQGEILFLMGNLQQAKTLLQQAITLDGNNQEILFHYAEVLAALGEKFLAEVYFERAQAAGFPEEIIKTKIDELKGAK